MLFKYIWLYFVFNLFNLLAIGGHISQQEDLLVNGKHVSTDSNKTNLENNSTYNNLSNL